MNNSNKNEEDWPSVRESMENKDLRPRYNFPRFQRNNQKNRKYQRTHNNVQNNKGAYTLQKIFH